MAHFGFFDRTYRHIARYREIIGVLIKYGFEDVLATIRIKRHLPFLKRVIKKKTARKLSERTRWERMRLVLEALGTTFIKLGQIMSNRPDLLPPSLTTELEKLQDAVPSFPFESAKAIIEAELNRPLDEVFRSVEEQPLASASIAQVHAAVLKNGQPVVIKVQRPDIRSTIEVDVDIMMNLAMLMKRYLPGMDLVDPVAVVKKFKQTIRKELNFVIEAVNMQRFKYNFRRDKTIYVPKAYQEWSTGKVLVMEHVQGIKVSKLDDLQQAGLNSKIIAKRGAKLIFQQVFEYGHFHADPHPGNIMVLPQNVICFVDFGMMGRILRNDREQLNAIIIGIYTQDTRRMIRALQKVSVSRDIRNIKQLEYRLQEFIEEYSMQSLRDVNLEDIARELRTMIFEHHIKVPPDFFLLLKALTTIEGVGRRLDPDFNAFEELYPYVRHIMRQRLNPVNLAKRVYMWTQDAGMLLRDLPFDTKDIMEKIKQGQLNIEIHHKGFDAFLHTLDRVSNRIVFSIVLAAMIVGSSLIVLSDIPPKWQEVPAIGIAGYLIAGMMGLWLLITILRRGRM